jgi:hypothetical protein
MAKQQKTATKLLAILAIAAVLVMGVGTYVLMASANMPGHVVAVRAVPTTAQGFVTVNVQNPAIATNVLP